MAASDGMKISVNVIAMIIGFVALIALVNYLLGKLDIQTYPLPLTLDWIFGKFSPL